MPVSNVLRSVFDAATWTPLENPFAPLAGDNFPATLVFEFNPTSDSNLPGISAADNSTVNTATDMTGNGRNATATVSNGPNRAIGAINSVNVFDFIGANNDGMTIGSSLSVFNNAAAIGLDGVIQIASFAATYNLLKTFASVTTNNRFTVQVLTSGKLRVSTRRVGSDATVNTDSPFALTAGVQSYVSVQVDYVLGFVRFQIDDNVTTVPINGAGQWSTAPGLGFTENVDATTAPVFGRVSGGAVFNGKVGSLRAWTGRMTEAQFQLQRTTMQATFETPLRRVSLDGKSRAESCAVKRSRPGGTFEITGGTSSPGTNKITSVTVDGSAITSAAVDWGNSHEATATALAANINAYTGTSGYRAHASGPRVIVESVLGGRTNNGKTLAVTVGGTVTVDTASQALAMGAVHTFTGTVLAGQANGAVKMRLLSWNDNTTETLSLRTVATVSGSTSVAREWIAKLFVPMGAHIATARLGSDPNYNEAINTVDGVFSGIRILCNGQSNMKKLWAEFGVGGALPFTVTRSSQKHRRASGDAPDGTVGGHWDLSARILSGTYVSTGESTAGPTTNLPSSLGWTPLNDGCGSNGTVRFAIEAETLVTYPIELVCVAIGSSGTATRIPAYLAPGAFEAGRNWDDFLRRVNTSGGFDFDAIVITDGEEEANLTTTFAAGKYTEYETAFIDLMRSADYCNEDVPVLLSVMGPSTTTGASAEDPLRPGYTYAERIRVEQLEMIYGGVPGVYVANIPLDAPLASGDNQHGDYTRYETFAQRFIRTALNKIDPATFTTGCTGAIATSMTCAAGSNQAVITFGTRDGGTGMTGISATTNFTGMRFKLDGVERSITASSASGWNVTVTFDGAAAGAGQAATWENLPGNNPNGTNALCDNGTIKALAHPTIDPIACTVA